MHNTIDFRSDTVTQPPAEMLEAMMQARVGDDVFGDDPTVNELQAKAARMFGKEDALFCPSGTMTNQIAINVHTRPGDEVICDKLSHIYLYEGGGIAFNSGCSVRLLNGDHGRFTADMVEQAIQADDPHFPVSRLVSIENTCNKGGGVVWQTSEIEKIQRTCKTHGLSLHLDGARLFNALAYTGEDPKAMGSAVDTISICLSKGLGCPVGSLLLGSSQFIKRARRIRKVLGGGMRQAGYLAAAGIYALDHHITRLQVDHEHAASLANTLKELDWVSKVETPQTNIVVTDLAPHINQADILERLKNQGIWAVGFGHGRIRFVTHLGITRQKIEMALDLLRKI